MSPLSACQTHAIRIPQHTLQARNWYAFGKDVYKPQWLVDCYEASRLVPLQPEHVHEGLITPATLAQLRRVVDVYGDHHTRSATAKQLAESIARVAEMRARGPGSSSSMQVGSGGASGRRKAGGRNSPGRPAASAHDAAAAATAAALPQLPADPVGALIEHLSAEERSHVLLLPGCMFRGAPPGAPPTKSAGRGCVAYFAGEPMGLVHKLHPLAASITQFELYGGLPVDALCAYVLVV